MLVEKLQAEKFQNYRNAFISSLFLSCERGPEFSFNAIGFSCFFLFSVTPE